MTITELIEQAGILRALIRDAQNDRTGDENRKVRVALDEARKTLADVVDYLRDAEEIEQKQNEEDELSYEYEHCSGRQDSFGYCGG